MCLSPDGNFSPQGDATRISVLGCGALRGNCDRRGERPIRHFVWCSALMAKRWPPLQCLTARSPYRDGRTFAKKASFTVGSEGLVALYSTDGKMLAGGQGKSIKLLESATGKCIHTLEGPLDNVTSVAFSPDGACSPLGIWMQKSVCGMSGVVRISRFWTENTGSARLRSVGTGGHWRRETQRDKSLCGIPARPRKIATIDAHVINKPVHCLAFAGSKMASGSDDGWIKLWTPGREKNFSQYTLILYAVLSISFLSDGKTLASGSDDGTAKVWDLTSGTAIAVFYHNEGEVTVERGR